MAKSRRIGRTVFFAIVLIAIGGGAWWYFKSRAQAPPQYQTAAAQRGAIVQSVTATGQLQPVVIVDVGSQVSGRLKEVLVDFNDQVKKDQVLARIDPATFEAAVAQAESELLNARANLRLQKSNLDRSRQLFEQNLVSSSALEQLEATLEQAETSVRIREFALDSRKTDLERCTILAPIDGIVISRNVQEGQTVAASLNAPVLFVIANDLTRMQISASVSEADVGSIAEQQEVTFNVDAFPGRTFPGKVRQVRNAAKNVENVITYETIIDVENPGGRLKPGMTANVSIIIAKRENALRLSNAALRVRVPEGIEVKQPPEEAGASPPAGGAMSTANGGDAERRARFQAMRANNPEMAARGRERAATTSRIVYKLTGPPTAPKLEGVRVRTGISDGSFTEVVSGIEEGENIVVSIFVPGARTTAPGAQSQTMRALGGAPQGGRGPRGF